MMDFATIFGLLSAVGIIVGAIYWGGNLPAFMDISAFMIVIVGSFAVTLIRFGFADMKIAFRVLLRIFLHRSETVGDLIKKSIDLSRLAKKNGHLALEKASIVNPFLSMGVEHILEGMNPDVLRRTLEKERQACVMEYEIGEKVFRVMGEVGPAMGMIGTLVGLIQLFGHMHHPEQLGPAMGLALLTTLYGALLSHVFALPIAEKLASCGEGVFSEQTLLIDALMGIQAGLNPILLEASLLPYLPAHQRKQDKARKPVLIKSIQSSRRL